MHSYYSPASPSSQPSLSLEHQALLTLVSTKQCLPNSLPRILEVTQALWFTAEEISQVNQYYALYGAKAVLDKWCGQRAHTYSEMESSVIGEPSLLFRATDFANPVHLLLISTLSPPPDLRSVENNFHRRAEFNLSEPAETRVVELLQRSELLERFKVKHDSLMDRTVEDAELQGVRFSLEWFGPQRYPGGGTELKISVAWQSVDEQGVPSQFARRIHVAPTGTIRKDSYSLQFAETGYEGHDFEEETKISSAEFQVLANIVQSYLTVENLLKPKMLYNVSWLGNSFF